jgi:RHS repeat-associated protein
MKFTKFFLVYVLIFLVFSKTLSMAHGFAGEVFDAESNLIYLRARYYDPETGTFLIKDPIGIIAGLNTYQYCSSNPINYADPTGNAEIYFYAEPLTLGSHGLYVIKDLDGTPYVAQAGPSQNRGSQLATLLNWVGVSGVFGQLKADAIYATTQQDLDYKLGNLTPQLLVNDTKPAAYYTDQINNYNNSSMDIN